MDKHELEFIRTIFKDYAVEYEDDVVYIDSHNRAIKIYKTDSYVIEWESGFIDKYLTLDECIKVGVDYLDFYWDKNCNLIY